MEKTHCDTKDNPKKQPEIFLLSSSEFNQELEVLKSGISHSVPWGLESCQRLKNSRKKMWGDDLCRTELYQVSWVYGQLWTYNVLMEEVAERGLNIWMELVIAAWSRLAIIEWQGSPNRPTVKPGSNHSKNKIQRSSGEAVLIHKQLVVLNLGPRIVAGRVAQK